MKGEEGEQDEGKYGRAGSSREDDLDSFGLCRGHVIDFEMRGVKRYPSGIC